MTIAAKLSAEEWSDLILTFSLGFEASQPSNLEKDLDEFFLQVDEEKDESKLDLSLS